MDMKGWTAKQALDAVHDLKTLGYTVGTDFDFAYIPEVQPGILFDYVQSRPRSVCFTFYNESMATWFAIAYT